MSSFAVGGQQRCSEVDVLHPGDHLQHADDPNGVLISHSIRIDASVPGQLTISGPAEFDAVVVTTPASGRDLTDALVEAGFAERVSNDGQDSQEPS